MTDTPTRPSSRTAQVFTGLGIALIAQLGVQVVALATAFAAAKVHPEYELDVFIPALFAVGIAEGLVLVAFLVAGIRNARRDRRPLGITLLAAGALPPLIGLGGAGIAWVT